MTIKQNQGFTLIEILVVLTILSIVLSFTLINFGDFGEERQVILAAEEFSSYLQLVQQQAILDGNVYGIKIDKNSYETFYVNQNGQWQRITNKRIFHSHHLPKKIITSLRKKHAAQAPDVIINASGEMTAFTLYLGTVKKPELTFLMGKTNGDIINALPPAIKRPA